jgi:hypothetical protein
LGAVRPQEGDAATVHGAALLLRHCLRQVVRGRCNTVEFQTYTHVDQMSHSQQASSKPVGDPNVALTVDAKTTVVDPVLKFSALLGSEAGKRVT